MSTLRERIAAKSRPRAVFPVRVGDVEAAQEVLATHKANLDLWVAARPRLAEQETFDPAAFDAEVAARQEAVREAKVTLADCYVDVELQSLEPDLFEQVLATADRDDDGDPDLEQVRAALLAASCVDPELQDEPFWTERLADPAWTRGEKLQITSLIMQLNLNSAVGRQGKG